MSTLEQVIIICLVALTTMATRFAPFVLFRSDKPTPKYLEYLGRALPPAVFGMLVVYCLKGLSFTAAEHWLPSVIGVAVVAVLHLAFRKMLLSIAGGTVVYMILINLVFI